MKIRLCLVALLTAALAAAVTVSAATGPDAKRERLFRAGQIDAAYEREAGDASLPEGQIAARGRDFVIPQDEVDRIAAIYSLTGVADGRRRALDELVRQETLYAKAASAGVEVSDDALETALSEQRAFFESAENYDDFLEYLKGAGWTADQYWEKQRASTRKQMAADRYLAGLRKQYQREHAVTGWEADPQTFWESFLEEQIAQWIQEQQVVVTGQGGH